MGSQGPGRKRIPNRVTAEEDALNIIAREAEAQLAAKRMARTEAREIRMRQLEMQQKEMMNEDDEEQLDGRNSVQGSSRVQTPSVATLSCLERPSTHIESEDSSVTVNEIKEYHELKDQIQDVESKYIQSLKEMKNSLTEMEEKYRKAMVSIAQLDNEKSALMYQVDTLKDSLLDLEEAFAESLKEIEEKSRDLEREKHVHSVMQFQINELKEAQKQSEERLTEIHQLRLKNDKFVTEVADLQETVEWKNKKIAALERQKEFSDAIRNERDELRDEVVQLRHILKKHGIVLGPDLSNNVEVKEQVTDVSASTKGQEGSSVLGIHILESGETVSACKEDQQPKDLDKRIQDAQLILSDKCSEMHESVDGVLSHCFNQNEVKAEEESVDKPQVSDSKTEKLELVLPTGEVMRAEEEDSQVSVAISKVLKQDSFTNDIPEDHLVSAKVENSEINQVRECFTTEAQKNQTPTESTKAFANAQEPQSTSVSNKKKKKKKNKQKQRRENAKLADSGEPQSPLTKTDPGKGSATVGNNPNSSHVSSSDSSGSKMNLIIPTEVTSTCNAEPELVANTVDAFSTEESTSVSVVAETDEQEVVC